MIRKLCALVAGALLGAFAFGQSVPNGTITQGQIWTTSQWNAAFQAKVDVSGGSLTAPTITGGASITGAVTGTSFAGAGTGLTGTAAGLSIGGNAATATSATTATTATSATSATTATNLGGGAAGEISFQTGAGTTSFTAAGTSGQVFTSAGTGTPTWTTLTGTSGANPTANVGLTAVPGIATTYMRSDGSPAISQSISPTMTGNWTFSGTVFAGVASPTIPFGGGSVASFNGGPTSSSGNAVVIAGGTSTNNVALAIVSRSSGEAVTINGQNVTGASHGLSIIAGTNSSDANTGWANASGGGLGFIAGDGGFVWGSSSDCGFGCINASNNIEVAGASVLTTSSTLTPNANNLTGTTLNSGVVNSSLTSVGTLSSLAVSGAVTVGGVSLLPTLSAHLATDQSTTSTTPAATALSLTLPVGVYAVDLFLDFNGTTTGTQGIKFNPNAGTSVTSGVLGSAVGSVAGTPINGNTASNLAFATISVSSGVDFLHLTYPVPVTVAGTYLITFAQNSSSANATNLRAGSYITATRLQ